MFSFLYHFQRLLPELTVYMSNTAGVLAEAGTDYPSRALEFSPVCFGEICVAIFCSFCVGRLCVLTFWVPCCDVRYDFRIKKNDV